MHAAPINSSEAIQMLYQGSGVKNPVKIFDQEAFNVNSQVEVSQNNIKKGTVDAAQRARELGERIGTNVNTFV